jgi:hypothetical protein
MKACCRSTGPKVAQSDLLLLLRDIAWSTALLQLILLLLVMMVGTPGVYTTDKGFMYISDNFCTKKALSFLFILSTLPTWSLLACSISLESSVVTRTILLGFMSVPFPTGIGIVVFSLCEAPPLHYTYVNIFVGTVAVIHLTVAYTASHFEFLQYYSIIVVGTAMCGLVFLVLATMGTSIGITRDTAVIMEYISVIGFIVLNGLSVDRIQEHITKWPV